MSGGADAWSPPFALFVLKYVLPIALATPTLLVLAIGRAFYKEHLSATAWIGCVLGALSVAVLAYGN